MHLSEYRDRYPNIAFDRRDGVLLVRLHTAGEILKFGIEKTGVHAQLPRAFLDVAADVDNRVVILTGTGPAFCESFDYASVSEFNPEVFDRLFKEGRDMLMNMLSIEVPIIGAINGPALIHAELLVLSDIVLAADTAVLADISHFVNGVVPGDGVNVCWPMLLGPNRARYFLLTGQRISALEAQSLGVVAEVLPAATLMERAWALGKEIASKPTLALRYTRLAFTQYLKRRMFDELGYSFALELAASAGRRYDAHMSHRK